jgi:putative glutamine amidotransferase
MARPVIGITSSQFVETASHGRFTRHSLTKDYSDAILAAGGTPIILPFYAELAVDTFELVDGIIVSGGADLDPALFGDVEIHPQTYDIIPERDDAELALARLAIARDKPLLGICRGIQVLNVAMGGSLYQDVPSQFSGSLDHRQQAREIPADEPGHTVSVAPGSLLESVFGSEPIPVNSFHHQAVRDLALNLVASGHSDDGVIEAIEHPGSQFALGVQWHPELMFKRSSQQLAPFTALVEACLKPAPVLG